ncbi:MAG: thiamine phosphate synthase, partial [Candidatus Gastranaerophilales bacterium]|nr:thiamine phosphate synthase [Candidatus Gastranaerophilales bacterium]
LKGGVQIVQLREKNIEACKIIELGKRIRELCSIYNALFIVNDRIDIAQIVHADGVHLGQEDIDIKSAREIAGENMIIGISTHCREQAIKAKESGADYIGAGPIFATPTKQNTQPVGFEYLNWVSKNIDIPYFAIGGIDLNNCQEVINQGAKRIAVVRAIMNADSPELNANKFINILSGTSNT